MPPGKPTKITKLIKKSNTTSLPPGGKAPVAQRITTHGTGQPPAAKASNLSFIPKAKIVSGPKSSPVPGGAAQVPAQNVGAPPEPQPAPPVAAFEPAGASAPPAAPVVYELKCRDCGIIGELDEHIEEFTCPQCGGAMLPLEKFLEPEPSAQPTPPSEDAPTISISKEQITEYKRNIKVATAVPSGIGGMLSSSLNSTRAEFSPSATPLPARSPALGARTAPDYVPRHQTMSGPSHAGEREGGVLQDETLLRELEEIERRKREFNQRKGGPSGFPTAVPPTHGPAAAAVPQEKEELERLKNEFEQYKQREEDRLKLEKERADFDRQRHEFEDLRKLEDEKRKLRTEKEELLKIKREFEDSKSRDFSPDHPYIRELMARAQQEQQTMKSQLEQARDRTRLDQEQIQSLQREKNDFERTRSLLEQDLKFVQDQAHRDQERIKALQGEKEELEKTEGRFDKDLKLAQSRIQTLQSEAEELERTKSRFDKDLKLAQERIQSLQDEKAELERTKSRFDEDLKLAQERIRSLQGEKAELEKTAAQVNELEHKNLELEVMKVEFEHKNLELEAGQEELKQRNRQLTEQLEQKKKDLEELKKSTVSASKADADREGKPSSDKTPLAEPGKTDDAHAKEENPENNEMDLLKKEIEELEKLTKDLE